MAITGTKAFTSGEVLTANDVNQYLMRGVKVFSSTAVRDAAYGGAGEPVLEEGETAFITGTDTLQVYGGTALGWLDYRRATAGQVLQVASTTKTDTFSTSSTTFTDVTGLSVSITPSATSSLVLVFATMNNSNDSAGYGFLQLVRGSTAIAIGDAAGNRSRATAGGISNQNARSFSIAHLDSPATTSATTYKVQARVQIGGNTYINRTIADTDVANDGSYRVVSSITVMEVSA